MIFFKIKKKFLIKLIIKNQGIFHQNQLKKIILIIRTDKKMIINFQIMIIKELNVLQKI